MHRCVAFNHRGKNSIACCGEQAVHAKNILGNSANANMLQWCLSCLQLQRYFDEMTTFSNLPDALA
jgi:hypothetical protein